MAKIISLFNHKGGVSKTTTTFNLGWALAELGHRVLIVDADPQCNLTGTVLGFSGQDDLDAFYASGDRLDIKSGLDPALEGQNRPIEAVNIASTDHENLFLLPGHIDLAEAETQLTLAVTASAAIPAIQNLPGSLRFLLEKTSQENEIDFVLVDMRPSVGTLNECLLMSSDYFIVPTSPDYYCFQAVESLSRVLPRWHDQVRPFRRDSLQYRMPTNPPKMIGIISQRYRPRVGNPSASFQEWIDRIKENVDSKLVPALEKIDMIVSREDYVRAGALDTPYNLVNIADFNTLIAQSQKHSTPVFALSDAQIERQGVILNTMKANRDDFRNTFMSFAKVVENIAV